MAYYDADPNAGGVVPALVEEKIPVAVFPGRERHKSEIPTWAVHPENVGYYIAVPARHLGDATKIARGIEQPATMVAFRPEAD